MFVVGLTGGISSGKSTVCKLFSDHGIAIIDADHVSHQLTKKNSPQLEHIVTHFGPSILKRDGDLDRRQLRTLIFSNAHEKKWLEEYLHPIIRSKMVEQIKTATSPYCIAAIPLLTESAGIDYIDRILVIDCNPDLQIQRTVARDNISSEQAQAIIDQQANAQQRFAIADDIIHNNSDLPQLKQRIDELHKHYCQLAESH